MRRFVWHRICNVCCSLDLCRSVHMRSGLIWGMVRTLFSWVLLIIRASEELFHHSYNWRLLLTIITGLQLVRWWTLFIKCLLLSEADAFRRR